MLVRLLLGTDTRPVEHRFRTTAAALGMPDPDASGALGIATRAEEVSRYHSCEQSSRSSSPASIGARKQAARGRDVVVFPVVTGLHCGYSRMWAHLIQAAVPVFVIGLHCGRTSSLPHSEPGRVFLVFVTELSPSPAPRTFQNPFSLNPSTDA